MPRYRGKLALGYACVLPAALLSLGIPRIIGHAIDRAIGLETQVSHLLLLGAVVLLLVALRGVFQFGQRWLLVGASREFERDLRADLYAKLLTLPAAYYSKASTGDIVARATSDVEAVRMTVGPGVMYLASTVVLVPTAIGWMMWENATLASFVLLPMILLSVVLGLLSPRLERASRRGQDATGKIAGAAAECFSGIQVLKIFTREDAQMRRLEALGLEYVAAQIQLARARGLAISSLHGLIGLSQLAILVVGSLQIVRGKFTVGDFFTFLEWLALCLWPLIAVGWMVGTIHRGAAAMDRINEIFDIPPEIQSGAVAADPGLPNDVRFDGVTVRYHGTTALDGVTLSIPAGTSLGITGRVGSGKSTLAGLLPRLFDPSEGQVTIGGVDVRDWQLPELRRRVSMVPQDAFLFSTSLRDNLLFAAPEPSEGRALQAARDAALDETLRELEAGLDTVLGERGLSLSGGQRQRATIARALAADSPVLVLDDCLSAVDAQTESRILRNLRAVRRGRTTLMVSHRAAALREMDRIAVLEDGKLVELGSYDELMQRGGRYADLERRQALEEELKEL